LVPWVEFPNLGAFQLVPHFSFLQATDCARNGNILRWLVAGTDPKSA
jgi:hypothetical protein